MEGISDVIKLAKNVNKAREVLFLFHSITENDTKQNIP